MKTKNLNEMKTKTQAELKTLVGKKKLELMKNKVKIAGGKEKNLKQNWMIRKEIAQIMSMMNASKLIKTKGETK